MTYTAHIGNFGIFFHFFKDSRPFIYTSKDILQILSRQLKRFM